MILHDAQFPVLINRIKLIFFPLSISSKGEMPNISLVGKADASFVSQIIIKAKEYVYHTSEKICVSHGAARKLSYQIIYWIEYIWLNSLCFSLSFNEEKLPLFCLLLIDHALSLPEYKKFSSKGSVQDLIDEKYTQQEIYKLTGEIEFLELSKRAKREALTFFMEELRPKVNLTNHEWNVSTVLVDAFNMYFFGSLSEPIKVISACISVTLFWIHDKEEVSWNKNLKKATGLKKESFASEYEKVYHTACIINKRNLEIKNRKTCCSSDEKLDSEKCLRCLPVKESQESETHENSEL